MIIVKLIVCKLCANVLFDSDYFKFVFHFRYHLIVRYYLKIGDYNSLTETCKRLGELQPSLWLQALTGLRDNKNAPPNLLSQVLQVIGRLRTNKKLNFIHLMNDF